MKPRIVASPTPVLGAIDVGTNAIRLELARPLPDGSLEMLHQERDPVRPGEGVFTSGRISQEVADRLLSALRRYAALCRRYGAKVRAVATSAVREARNRDDIVRRTKQEAGLNLEVVSGREEARLICLGVLQGAPPLRRSICIDLGGGSTEVAHAIGERPTDLWSVPLGGVRLTEMFDCAGKVTSKRLKLLCGYADEVVRATLPSKIKGAPKTALGSSGTIAAVVSFAAQGTAQATLPELNTAVFELAEMGPERRRKRFDRHRADIVVAGAVILEAMARHLQLESVSAVNRGLREGLLLDLMRRQAAPRADRGLHAAATWLGRRFYYDEPHARQVCRIALALFDAMADASDLSEETRPLLEAAALLHDIGNAVSHERHHKHTYYLVTHADLPGLADRERELVALIARYHRRSPPELNHPGMALLSRAEAQKVRKLSTLLRVADSLDMSHQQPIGEIRVQAKSNEVLLRFKANHAVDLELWDLAREQPYFERVFGKRLTLRG